MGLLGDVFKIGGSLLGGGSSSKSAKAAADAQVKVAQMNNDLAREFRAENTANLSPFMNRGNLAGGNINALLGLGGNRPAARNAYNQYLDSVGYRYRVGEGMNALNNGYAAKGALRSGAAMKDFMRFGQNIASDEFGRYLGYLGGQQGTGLSAASAIAGVGNTALNAMSQNNQNAADASSNAALIGGTANSNMWAGIGNSLGNMFSSSFGGMNQNNINRISGDVQNTLNTNSSIF